MTGATSLHMDVTAAPGTPVASSTPLTVASRLAPAGARTVTTATTLHVDVVAAVGAVLARVVAHRGSLLVVSHQRKRPPRRACTCYEVSATLVFNL